MGLPFKNGFELAQAMGYGKMYQASKQQEENNVQMESKKPIRITESELHWVIKESVKKVLKEVGETEDGQYLLGRLAGKKAFNGDYNGYSDVMDYAKQKRNGDLKKSDIYARGFHSEKDKLKERN